MMVGLSDNFISTPFYLHSNYLVKLEVFIEHIPCAEQCSYNRRDISADAHRTGAITYTVFVYGHIQGVGVTAYCI